MAKKEIRLAAYEDIFSSEESRQDDKRERVLGLAPTELKPFKDHPFHVQADAELQKLAESIREHGILSPLIARPTDDGYELVSGHRRKLAAEIVGLDTLPVLVREMPDDEAVVLMVDSNIQRENLLPSEKAFAYKMKLEAMKRQGKRTDLTSCQVGTKLRSDALIAEKSDDSARMIQRYIRLTELLPELLQMVDDKRIAFSPAVELSYLKPDEQKELLSMIHAQDSTPSLSQAIKLKKLSQIGRLSQDVIFSIMTEEKPNQKEQVRIPTEKLRQYFPKHYTTEQMEQALFKLLEERQRKLQKDRDMER